MRPLDAIDGFLGTYSKHTPILNIVRHIAISLRFQLKWP